MVIAAINLLGLLVVADYCSARKRRKMHRESFTLPLE